MTDDKIAAQCLQHCTALVLLRNFLHSLFTFPPLLLPISCDVTPSLFCLSQSTLINDYSVMFVCLWLHSASCHLLLFFSSIRYLLLTNVSCLLPSPLASEILILQSILLSQLFLHLPSYLTREADCHVKFSPLSVVLVSLFGVCLVLVVFLAAFNEIASLNTAMTARIPS